MSNQPELAVGPGDEGNYQPLRVDADGNLRVVQGATTMLAPAGYTKLEVTSYNGAGSPTTLVYSKGVSVLATWHITYNVSGDFQKAERV